MAEFRLDGDFRLDAAEKSVEKDSVEVLSDDEEFEPVVFQKEQPHVSEDHIHGQGYRWRQHFDARLIDRFSTYIYAFAWEDPRVDLQFLDLKKEDHMFVITSGGCNVLEYAAQVGPER
jgi:betaine lipid synthase